MPHGLALPLFAHAPFLLCPWMLSVHFGRPIHIEAQTVSLNDAVPAACWPSAFITVIYSTT